MARAKLNGLRFRENENRARVILRLYVPAQSRPAWFEHVVPLQVDVVDGGTVAGSADLQLKVVGSPALLLSTDNLLVNLRTNEQQLPLTIENIGGVVARDLRFEANVVCTSRCLDGAGRFTPDPFGHRRRHSRRLHRPDQRARDHRGGRDGLVQGQIEFKAKCGRHHPAYFVQIE